MKHNKAGHNRAARWTRGFATRLCRRPSFPKVNMSKFWSHISIIIFVTVFVTGCGVTPPKPNESDYFISQGGGFSFDKESKEAWYGLTISSKGNVVPGNFIEVEYQNPLGGNPLASSHLVQNGETKFILKSPPVRGLRAYTNYQVTIFLYSSDSKSNLLGKHKQKLQNLVSQSDLGW